MSLSVQAKAFVADPSAFAALTAAPAQDEVKEEAKQPAKEESEEESDDDMGFGTYVMRGCGYILLR